MDKIIFNDFIKENIAPYSAERIGIYNKLGKRVGIIPLGNFKPTYGERKYRFGLLSDIHVENDQTTESKSDFTNALKYLNDKESVDFVCSCGDLTQTASDQEFGFYQEIKTANLLNKELYTCTGNHDCPHGSSIDVQRWKKYTNCDRTFEVSYPCGTKTDHFLFLSLNDRNLGESAYLDEDLQWLEQKLEQYKEERCFIFTHIFFNDKAGDFKHVYPYDRLVGTIETRLLALNKKYINNVWFSGHSHWKWYLQEYDKKSNVYVAKDSEQKRIESYTVHCPSCAKPRDHDEMVKASGYITKSLHSEGAIIDVYDDYIDIRGMEFKGEGDLGYTNRYLPIATYRIDTKKITPEISLLKASNFTFRKGVQEQFRAEDDGDGYVKITFDAYGNHGFFVSSNSYTGNDIKCMLKVYDWQFVSPEASQWTDGMKNALGFQTYSNGIYGYTQSDSEVRVDDNDGKMVHFNMSKSFPSNTSFPVIVRFKADLLYEPATASI